MCGELRHSQWSKKERIRVGSDLPTQTKIFVDGKRLKGTSVFNGHAREESLNNWIQKGWKKGTIEIESYSEQNVWFQVPKNNQIEIIILEKNKNYLNIITRNAQTKEERNVHPRHPKFIEKK